MKDSSKMSEGSATQQSSRCPTCGESTPGSNQPRWLQINLAPPERRADAHWSVSLVDALLTELRTLRRTVAFDCVFFMRKPPGLRLRLRAAGQAHPELRARLAEICNVLRARALCGRSFLSCYEPETFQFGGPHAMEIVHRYFSADTRAWCAHAKLLLRGRALIAAEVLSLAVLNDLFHRALRGSEDEVWDTWCNLSLVHGRRPQLSDRPLRAPSLEELLLAASPPERGLLRSYRARNVEFARRLWRAHEAGQLLYGMRLILPFVALFHWNRYALVSEQRDLICDSMYTRLHTKRGLLAG